MKYLNMETIESKRLLIITALILNTKLTKAYCSVTPKELLQNSDPITYFAKINPKLHVSLNLRIEKIYLHTSSISFFKKKKKNPYLSATLNHSSNNHYFNVARARRKIGNRNKLESRTTRNKSVVSDGIYFIKKHNGPDGTSNASEQINIPSVIDNSSSIIANSVWLYNKSDPSDQRMKKFKEMYPIQLWKDGGWFSDDYLPLINAHWLSFEPPQHYVQYALGFAYILLMLLGCSGNAIVLLMFIRCRSLRTPANILVANLAISDFLMMAKTPIFIYNSFHLGPALGKTGCILYGFLGGLTGTVTITTLSAIAFDRYSVVVNPLDPLKSLNNVRAKLLVVSTWVYGCVFAIVPALDIGYGRYSPEGYLTSCSFDYLLEEKEPKIFIFIFFVAAWLLPFIIISFCYIKILTVVIKTASSSKATERTLSTRHIKEQVKRKAELKLSALVIVVIALFFVSWTPYALVSLIAIFGRPDLVTPIVSMAPALFCKTASCINPFIYIMTHPKFRKEFEQMFCKRKGSLRKPSAKRAGWSEGVKEKLEKELISDDGIEIVEVRNIPFANTDNREHFKSSQAELIMTVSSHVNKLPGCRQDSDGGCDGDVVPPPSWFVQPQFSKQNSFKKSFY